MSSSERTSPNGGEVMMHGRPLRGAVALSLIHRAALGTETDRELAEAFGVAPSAIHKFRHNPRNVEAIEARRVEIENELTGLWSAKLCNRVAELEADVDRVNEVLEDAAPELLPRLLAAKRTALREIAEQLGALAPRQINVGTTVRYEIVGVDLENLR